ncbi:unnamed protein product [Hydatigera taeniaeformis]|uniref:Uncharacterized protein n=1 Tax=Hydatigena taeniaeformis TaxID=6205 RepID=A0A0R3XDE5_HYDTA|nr:unnamed protein product [Hydatigera taeniaeformis]
MSHCQTLVLTSVELGVLGTHSQWRLNVAHNFTALLRIYTTTTDGLEEKARHERVERKEGMMESRLGGEGGQWVLKMTKVRGEVLLAHISPSLHHVRHPCWRNGGSVSNYALQDGRLGGASPHK